MRALEKLLEFPYIENYLELALVEWDLADLTPEDQIAFLGGGPYPLTAIALVLIAQAVAAGSIQDLRGLLDLSDPVTKRSRLRDLLLNYRNHPATFSAKVIERDAEAIRLSRSVVSALKLDCAIEICAMEAADYRISDKCRALFLASMVRDKLTVLRSIFSEPPKHPIIVLLRSVQSGTLRELLYEPVSAEVRAEELLALGLYPAKIFTPERGARLINSVEVHRYEPRTNR